MTQRDTPSSGPTFRLPTIRSAVEFRREAMCWSKAEMARRLGLQRAHYCEFVSGSRGLPKKAMCKAFELGVPADVLLQTPATKRAYEDRQRRLLAAERKQRLRPRYAAQLVSVHRSEMHENRRGE